MSHRASTFIPYMLLLITVIVLLPGPARGPTTSTAPHITLADIQRVADLVALRVPMHQIVEAKIEGFSGGVSGLLVVRGEAWIGTDVLAAEIEIDDGTRTVTVALPRPTVLACRLDHERTSVFHVGRHGAWVLLPGPAGEAKLVERALRDAQRQLEAAAGAHPNIEAACRHAEDVLNELVGGRGWRLRLVWIEPQHPRSGRISRARSAPACLLFFRHRPFARTRSDTTSPTIASAEPSLPASHLPSTSRTDSNRPCDNDKPVVSQPRT